jgi:zinc/manganese transport system substrate-binding protein
MKKILIAIFFMLYVSMASAVVNIVAAENFYGELASEIGGNSVKVTSILNNPNVDPHIFSSSAATIKALNNAQIIIYNGAGYDEWMQKALNVLPNKKVIIINVAQLINNKDGNPHIWYQPQTFGLLANKLKQILITMPNIDKENIVNNYQIFMHDNKQVLQKIAGIRTKYKAITVTATEPVYNYMAQAMGFKVVGQDLQWHIMNDTEPSPREFANFNNFLIHHQVKLIYYNNQVSSNLTKNLLNTARNNKIPVIGVTELMPANTTINQWLMAGLITTENTLNKN